MGGVPSEAVPRRDVGREEVTLAHVDLVVADPPGADANAVLGHHVAEDEVPRHRAHGVREHADARVVVPAASVIHHGVPARGLFHENALLAVVFAEVVVP